MALSRKRRKELNRLKAQAEDLWDDQKELLDHATKVVRRASRQAAHYAREEVAPRVRDTYEDRVRPAFESGVSSARSAARTAGKRFSDDVLPAMTGALGTALAALEVAKNREVREAIARASRGANAVGTKLGLVQAPKPGPGRYILIGIGVVAAIGVAYAAWQTLRADDELWVDDEAAPADDLDNAES
jgi:hypothetical protein